MQTISPPNTIEPALGTESRDARIAVALFCFPMECNLLAFTMFHNMLDAGLKRNGVEARHGAYYRKNYAVSSFTLREDLRAAAIASIRQTLSELTLIEVCIIATYTPDDVWVVIQGFGKGGTTFDKAFLDPAEFEACQKEFEAETKENMAKLDFIKTVLSQLRQSLSADGGGNADSGDTAPGNPS